VRRDGLDVFHKSVYPELRVYLDKQRNVVGDDFQSHDFGSISQSRLRYQLEETLGNLIHKHFTTVLRAPNNMVIAAVCDVVICLVSSSILRAL